MAEEPENLVLVQLQGIRRELRALLEQHQTFARQQVRVELQRQMGEVHRQIGELRSDMVLLENHNVSRPDGADREHRGPVGLVAGSTWTG